MSKGLGHVGRAIKAAFEAKPDHAFTVDELCWLVYLDVDRVEKKHRVAVLRAAFRQPALLSIYQGKALVFFVLDNVKSYGMARLKPSRFHDEQILARLEPGGDQHDAVIEGGPWWNHVEQYKAERDGDMTRLQHLRSDLHRQAVARQAERHDAVVAAKKRVARLEAERAMLTALLPQRSD